MLILEDDTDCRVYSFVYTAASIFMGEVSRKNDSVTLVSKSVLSQPPN